MVLERRGAQSGEWYWGGGKMRNVTVHHAQAGAALRRYLTTFSFALVSVATLACASSGVGMRAAQSANSPASIVVENNSWDRVTVYVSRGDQLWRLGDVGALGRTEFPIQRFGFLTDGRSTYLVAHPLAGRSFRSEQFMFPSGGVAVWTIENQNGLSHVSVR